MEFVNGYEVRDFVENECIPVDVVKKTIGEIIDQPIITGESEGQYLSFMIDRHYSGMDFASEDFSIIFLYRSPVGFINVTQAVNVRADSNMIKFGWAIPAGACVEEGELQFLIEIDSIDGSFTWKSKTVTLNVVGSLNVADISTEPVGDEWYTILQNRCDAILNKAEEKVNMVENALNDLDEAKEIAIAEVNDAADMTYEKANVTIGELTELIDIGKKVVDYDPNTTTVVEKFVSGGSTMTALSGVVLDLNSVVVTVAGEYVPFTVEYDGGFYFVELESEPVVGAYIYVLYKGTVNIRDDGGIYLPGYDPVTNKPSIERFALADGTDVTPSGYLSSHVYQFTLRHLPTSDMPFSVAIGVSTVGFGFAAPVTVNLSGDQVQVEIENAIINSVGSANLTVMVSYYFLNNPNV